MFHRVLELAQGIDPFHIDRERAMGELAGEATVGRSDLSGRRFRSARRNCARAVIGYAAGKTLRGGLP